MSRYNRLNQLKLEKERLYEEKRRRAYELGDDRKALAPVLLKIKECKRAIVAEERALGAVSGKSKRPNPKRRAKAKAAKAQRQQVKASNLSSAYPVDLERTTIRTNGVTLGKIKGYQHKVAGSGLQFGLDREKYINSAYCKPHERVHKRFAHK